MPHSFWMVPAPMSEPLLTLAQMSIVWTRSVSEQLVRQ